MEQDAPGPESLMRAALAGDAVAYGAVLAWVAGRVTPAAGPADEPRIEAVLRLVHALRHTWEPDRPLAPWADAIIVAAARRGARPGRPPSTALRDALASRRRAEAWPG